MEDPTCINYSPPFRNPLTDLASGLFVQQFFGRCAYFEMRYMECLEAYGADQGQSQCKLQRIDFKECISQDKQMHRYVAMRKERVRQAKEKHEKTKYLPPPPKDAYTFMDSA